MLRNVKPGASVSPLKWGPAFAIWTHIVGSLTSPDVLQPCLLLHGTDELAVDSIDSSCNSKIRKKQQQNLGLLLSQARKLLHHCRLLARYIWPTEILGLTMCSLIS